RITLGAIDMRVIDDSSGKAAIVPRNEIYHLLETRRLVEAAFTAGRLFLFEIRLRLWGIGSEGLTVNAHNGLLTEILNAHRRSTVFLASRCADLREGELMLRRYKAGGGRGSFGSVWV